MNTITIHTDGSCETQTRLGGWAAVLQCGEHQRVLQGHATDTTVNVMELTAVIEALRAIKQAGSTVQVFADSNYVVKGINDWLSDWIARGWKNAQGKPIANQPLWQQLKFLLDQHQVTLTWIPREQNAEADRLAQSARTSLGIQDHVSSPSIEEAQTPAPQPITHIMIAGSRYATREMRHYARRVVRRAAQLGHVIVVGDNPKGVDLVVVQECRRLQAKVVVVGIANYPRNGGCKHGSYIKVERDTYRGMGGNLLDAYTVRDRYMADMSQLGVFVWDGRSPGTKTGHSYMASRGKQAHLINFAKEARRD